MPFVEYYVWGGLVAAIAAEAGAVDETGTPFV